MIKIYTNSSDASSYKAKEWLTRQQLDFEEINWRKKGMSLEEFYRILSLTEKGTEDIIAKQSLAYQSFSIHMDDFSLKDVYAYIHCQRNLLRLPLIIDEKHLQVGFNSDEIRKFIPREIREVQVKLLNNIS